MKNLYTWVAAFLFVALAISVMACTSASSAGPASSIELYKIASRQHPSRGVGKEISGVAARRPDRTFRGNQCLVGKG